MKEYTVKLQLITYTDKKVEAENEQEAKDKALDEVKLKDFTGSAQSIGVISVSDR